MSDTTQKEWNRIMSERIVGNGKPATPQPPEWKGDDCIAICDTRTTTPKRVWIDDGPHEVTPDWWDKVAEAMFTARRKAKRVTFKADTGNTVTHVTREEIIAEKQSRWTAEDRARILARAMSAPLPHDPPMSVRLMPWKGKTDE